MVVMEVMDSKWAFSSFKFLNIHICYDILQFSLPVGTSGSEAPALWRPPDPWLVPGTPPNSSQPPSFWFYLAGRFVWFSVGLLLGFFSWSIWNQIGNRGGEQRWWYLGAQIIHVTKVAGGSGSYYYGGMVACSSSQRLSGNCRLLCVVWGIHGRNTDPPAARTTDARSVLA